MYCQLLRLCYGSSHVGCKHIQNMKKMCWNVQIHKCTYKNINSQLQVRLSCFLFHHTMHSSFTLTHHLSLSFIFSSHLHYHCPFCAALSPLRTSVLLCLIMLDTTGPFLIALRTYKFVTPVWLAVTPGTVSISLYCSKLVCLQRFFYHSPYMQV